ncbi:MAG: M24 family metallopeptidase, partial [Candidatus Gastranaerophilales bacterium]|nr:M24 family metallopeptidase [Candidatus Gastranaerophilales bacterium]
RGLNFEITENTTGFDIDAAVREVLNANKPEGFEFSHSTGHGVGIMVHETPPRISSSEASKAPLKPGMVFSIEPGLYNEKLGGVRIENTVAIAAKDGKARIRTLTRANLDDALIDYDMLDETEKRLLYEYKRLKIG